MALCSTLDSSRHEIRLCSISSGTFAEEIHCKLTVVSLDEHPRYEALSYTRGDHNNVRPIFLDGCGCKVTANLECALRGLRRGDGEPRILWVDALCINQEDILERGQQTSIMRNIYEGAQDVLIWLVEWDSLLNQVEQAQDIVGAFNVISQLAANRHFHEIFFFQKSEHAIHCSPPEVLSALVSLMQHPWWNRAWVVQETVVATHATLIWGELDCRVARARKGCVEHNAAYCRCLLRKPLDNPPCQHGKYNIGFPTGASASISSSRTIQARRRTTAAVVGASECIPL